MQDTGDVVNLLSLGNRFNFHEARDGHLRLGLSACNRYVVDQINNHESVTD